MGIATCPNCGAKNRVDERAARATQTVCGRCRTPLDVPGDAAETGHPVTVTDATFEQEVLGAGSRPVLLDCWAAWCGPCRMIAPVLDQLASESNGRYTIAKLNVDENPQTAARFGVRSIPTLLIFKNGQLRETLVGSQPKQALAARLAAHV
ncbi:MAG: thioredoxin [Acidobacteria bacterium]|nr:thioredoxin [Acidobacteriota bacterium]